MTSYDKLATVESLCNYLLDCVYDGKRDEHWYPILNAQTKSDNDDDLKDVVVQLFRWASDVIDKESKK